MNIRLVAACTVSAIYREAELVLEPYGLTPIAGGAVIAADFTFRLSGGAANSDPNASIGGAKSSTVLVDNTDNNLFDDVTGAEHTAGRVEYRCLYLHNANGSTQMDSALLWIASDTTGVDSDLSVSVGNAAVNATETAIANETTAPTGGAATFSDAAVSRATGLALGSIPAGQHKAFWLRRTITAGSTPQAADTAQIQCGSDTL